MSTEFSGLDLCIETVRGVRSFDVDLLGRLTGVSYKSVWTPGENVATCRRDPGADLAGAMRRVLAASYGVGGYMPSAYTSVWEEFTAPKRKRGTPPEPPSPPPHTMADCGCGFYGYYDGSDDYKAAARVSAVIEGYGETVVGTRGFRCSKARILALCIREPKPGKPFKASKHLPPLAAERVRRNYAGIPVYTDFGAMLADFPIDRSWEPAPDIDPDFWTRATK